MKEDEDEEDSDDEEGSGKFFNELYSLQVEGERATWHLVQLSGAQSSKSISKYVPKHWGPSNFDALVVTSLHRIFYLLLFLKNHLKLDQTCMNIEL